MVGHWLRGKANSGAVVGNVVVKIGNVFASTLAFCGIKMDGCLREDFYFYASGHIICGIVYVNFISTLDTERTNK